MMRGYGIPKYLRYFIRYDQESAAFCRLAFVRSSLVAGVEMERQMIWMKGRERVGC
jgi:hypothetical protein